MTKRMGARDTGLNCLRENPVVPPGLWVFFPLYPALKALDYPVPRLRRCIPAGNGLLCSTNCFGNRVLTQALKARSTYQRKWRKAALRQGAGFQPAAPRPLQRTAWLSPVQKQIPHGLKPARDDNI